MAPLCPAHWTVTTQQHLITHTVKSAAGHYLDSVLPNQQIHFMNVFFMCGKTGKIAKHNSCNNRNCQVRLWPECDCHYCPL